MFFRFFMSFQEDYFTKIPLTGYNFNMHNFTYKRNCLYFYGLTDFNTIVVFTLGIDKLFSVIKSD